MPESANQTEPGTHVGVFVEAEALLLPEVSQFLELGLYHQLLCRCRRDAAHVLAKLDAARGGQQRGPSRRWLKIQASVMIETH
jgi:hypothetical protein